MSKQKMAALTASALAALFVAAKIDESDVISLVAYKAIDLIKAVASVFGLTF